jgi:hypothetical protein
MAEFTADLNPKQNSMSLGDLMKMGLYSAEASIARVQASQAQQELKELQPVRAFMSNPENYSTDGKLDPDKAAPALMAIAPLTGPKHLEKLQTLATNQTAIANAKMNLTTKERQVFAQVDGALGQAKETDPNAYINAYKTLAAQYPNNPDIAKLAEAKISNVKLAGQGDHQWQQAQRSANTMMTVPELQSAFAPKAEIATIGGAQRPVVRQPSIEGRAPSITPTEFGGGPNAVGGGGTTEAPKPSAKDRDLIKYDQYLEYKDNPALANYTDEQRDALKEGKLLLKESNAIAYAAKEQEANTRGVMENISATRGSRPGQMVRQGGKWLIGNATQEMLNKNIARMAAASEVMGTAKTDQSRADGKVINGNDDLTDKALTDIASRADATVKAATMFNKAYNHLIEKRNVNGYIQSEKLKSAWVDNYDVRMAQMDALAASNSPEEKEKIKEIYATIPKNQREIFERKWSNLHALEQGKFR